MKNFFAKASEINFLILIISYSVYPLTFILVKLKVKPNLITFISLLLAIFASFQFIFGNFKYFTIFWISSLALDFCDGQVARISKSINKTFFNFDLLSDLLKIFLIILSSAIYYNIEIYWVISCSFIFLFLFNEVLVTYSIHLKKKKSFFQTLVKNRIYVEILNHFKHFFLQIDAHSHLLFLLLALNLYYAVITIIYMQFVLLLNIFRISYLLMKSDIPK